MTSAGRFLIKRCKHQTCRDWIAMREQLGSRGREETFRGQRSPDGTLVEGVHGRTSGTVKHTAELLELRHAADHPADRQSQNR